MQRDDSKIHVARNGQVLGIYDSDKLVDLLEMGRLLPTDQFYDETAAEWRPLSTWKDTPLADEFKTTEEAGASPEKPDGGKGRGRSGRKKGGKLKNKRRETVLFGGWIACLFALGAAAGMWAWAQNLDAQLQTIGEKLRMAGEKSDTLSREKQLLAEVSPAGRVRGIFTYEPSPTQAAIISGATIGLYRRAEVESALQKAIAQNPSISAASFEPAIEQLKGFLTTPLKISLSDSNGRFDLEVPEPGEYVLVASAGKKIGDDIQRYVWIVGFLSQNQPSNLILLNEKNSLSSKKPRLKILTLPSFVWKEETDQEPVPEPQNPPQTPDLP